MFITLTFCKFRVTKYKSTACFTFIVDCNNLQCGLAYMEIKKTYNLDSPKVFHLVYIDLNINILVMKSIFLMLLFTLMHTMPDNA